MDNNSAYIKQNSYVFKYTVSSEHNEFCGYNYKY